MEQNAFVTVDKGDFRFAGCGRGETRVKSKNSFRAERADINDVLTERAL